MYEKQRTMANGLPERERQKEREWEKNDENFVTFKLDMRVRAHVGISFFRLAEMAEFNLGVCK